MWLAGGLVAAFLFTRGSWRSVAARLRPFLIFLPLLLAGYVFFTLILTSGPPVEAVRAVVPSAVRIVLLMGATSVFLEAVNSADLLDALRTLWVRSGFRWRPVDDFFLLVYIAFRFFPILKEEVDGFINADRALGIPRRQGRLGQIRRWTAGLPGIIASCLTRADNLGMIMGIRGYGRVLPRGIASPFPFSVRDLFAITSIALFAAGYLFVA